MPTRVVNLNQFIGDVGEIPEELSEAIVRGLRSAAARGVSVVVGEIEAAKLVNTGQLRQSVNSKPITGGAEINVDAPHAPFMEYGRRPGKLPPPGPIFEWVMRKGLASDEKQGKQIAFAIAQGIANNGIKPRRFFAKAMKKIVKSVIPVEVKREVEKI